MAMQTVQGELTNNLAELSALEEHIALKKRKRQAHDDEEKRRITERMWSSQDEREARLAAASANHEAFRTQVNRIREKISTILHDTTLGEHLRMLFVEQGVTSVFILTALGKTISNLVLAITGGGGGAAAALAPAPASAGGAMEKVVMQLKARKSGYSPA